MSRGIREDVKSELIATAEKSCCAYPFLSGAIRGAGELSFTLKGFALEFRLTDERFAEKLKTIVNSVLNESFIVEKTLIDVGYGRNKEEYFTLRIPAEPAEGLLEKCGIVKNRCELLDYIPENIIKKNCCKRAYLRGLYLSCGSLTVPDEINEWTVKKTRGGYSVVFNLNSGLVLNSVIDLLAQCAQIDREKILVRKDGSVIYVKNSSAVSSILAAMGSATGVLGLEEIMLERQMKNDLNRAQNFDMANINKLLGASMKQCEDIRLIEDNIGLDSLPDALAETCRIRTEYPDLNLEELGKKFNPPKSKSCINHRLRKIAEIADGYRK